MKFPSRYKIYFTSVLLLIIGWLSYLQLNTPEPALPGYTPDSYSAYRAIEYLKQIAHEPHSGGTVAHKKVRNYIFDFCKKNQLETRVFNHTGMSEYGQTVVVGNAFNILAKVPGTNPTKAILVMGHYDSQPNTPAAADAGSAVASMLEIITLLKNRPLANDVYFLFTDLEEVGLLGAEAFVNSYDALDEIGLILNFEARGNSGVNFTFETSDDNGWIINEFAKSTKKPLANALAFEVYKLMPNNTDFTMFRKTGISGLNTAYIDGHSYYHSPADTHQNIDLGSLQHQGDLMWGMVTHFGNLDLTATKSENAIYFNIFNTIVQYPQAADWPLILTTIALFILVVGLAIKRQLMSTFDFVKGFISSLMSLILALLLVWLFNYLVLILNPHYTSFYNNNFYNANFYLISIVGIVLLVTGVLRNVLFKTLNSIAIILGAFLIQVALVIVLKNVTPTGAYIIYLPLLVALMVLLFNVYKGEINTTISTVLLPILPLILWIPLIYLLYIVFSLSLPMASALFVVLLISYVQPIADSWRDKHKLIVPVSGLLLTITGFGIAQINAQPKSESPQQTKLAYGLDLDQNQAFWISIQQQKDEFIERYIQEENKVSINEFYPSARGVYWKSPALLTNVASGKIEVSADTTISGVRSLTLQIKPGYGVTQFSLYLPEGVQIKSVDSRLLSDSNTTRTLQYYAPARSGARIEVIAAGDGPISVVLVESKIEIDPKLLTYTLPDHYVFGTGSMSNNMLLKQTIIL